MHWQCLLAQSITCNTTTITFNRRYTFNEHTWGYSIYDFEHDKEIAKVLHFYTHYVKRLLYVPMHYFAYIYIYIHKVTVANCTYVNIWSCTQLLKYMVLQIYKIDVVKKKTSTYNKMRFKCFYVIACGSYSYKNPNGNQDNLFVRLVFALLAT